MILDRVLMILAWVVVTWDRNPDRTVVIRGRFFVMLDRVLLTVVILGWSLMILNRMLVLVGYEFVICKWDCFDLG